MRLDTSQHMRTDMRLRMAPRMIQSMEILQLPAMALQERIDQELIENPLLVDLRDSRVSTDTGDGEASPESTTNPGIDGGEDAVPFDGYEEWAESYGEMHRPSRAALSEQGDRKLEAMQNMAGRPRSFHDLLVDQLSFFDVDPTRRALAEYIIYNLDENGYLTLDLAEIARDFGGSATEGDAERALHLVQRLDPPGVGARNLQECLILQLTPEVPHHDILKLLLTQHIDDLQHNRLPQIEKKTGIPLDTIKDALESLRRLDPRPGNHEESERSLYVVPDLIVELNDAGAYEVRLLDEHTPQLSISRRYQKLLKNNQADPEARAYIQKKLQAARWLIESVEQRRSTLLKVARSIVERQTGFLDNGPEFLEPLKMQQIADKVGVHVTTVSRAVDDKWIQTPRGNFPLKRFFGGGTKTADGEEMAWDTIKQKMLEIVGKEDKSNPMSDEEIVDELEKLGIPVARRTVSKYRKALKIPSSRQRKVF